MSYKYGGDFVWKETPQGLEQFVVGDHRESTAPGGFGSRLRRRARRAMFPGAFASPFPSFGPPLFCPPGFPSTFAPQFPPPPTQPIVAAVAVPAQSKAAPAEPPSDNEMPDWQKDESKRKWGGDSWGKNAEWAKPKEDWAKKPAEQWAKKPKWQKVDAPKFRGANQAQHGVWINIEKSIRLSSALSMYGPKWKLQWCLDCRLKAYVGSDLCSTPGCRFPENLRHLLPPKPHMDAVQHVEAVIFEEA